MVWYSNLSQMVVHVKVVSQSHHDSKLVKIIITDKILKSNHISPLIIFDPILSRIHTSYNQRDNLNLSHIKIFLSFPYLEAGF